MGIDIAVTRNPLEPIPDDASWFGLNDSTARALSRQPEATLSHGIDAVSTTVFSRKQLNRLLQEFRYLAQQSDEVARRNLEDAASFIEQETSALGQHAECYVVFVGE